MRITLDQMRDRILESGVLAVEHLRAAVDSEPPERRPSDGEQLARRLVGSGLLTRFQAQMILEGKGRSLVMGNYVLLDKLGQGGMGAVFKAQHRRMKRLVALKVVAPNLLRTPTAVARFQREVEVAARLSHPNVVTAFDADESRGVRYLVMEYVEGTDLASRVDREGPLTVEDAVRSVVQAARGLAYAHRQGVVHRDIKPANLLCDRSGTVKVLDLGLARFTSEGAAPPEANRLTETGQIMGTVDFMAPEQAENTQDADARSDIYSLGCTLWFLLTGRPVFEGGSAVQKLLAHREQPPPSLRVIRPEMSEALDQVFRRMVAKRPADRFPNMQEVAKALETCLDGATVPATEPAGNISDPEVPQGRSLRSPEPVGRTSRPGTVLRETAPAGPSALAPTTDFSPAPALDGRTTATTAPMPGPRSFRWSGRVGAITGALAMAAVLALLMGIVLKVRTPTGTIVLEIDQPEAAEAEVTVDEQHRVRLRPGPNQEPITVAADEKTHELKVTKGGFETFTKSFTVRSGKSTPIRVRLEPNTPTPAAARSDPAVGPFAADRTAARRVLDRGGFVEVLVDPRLVDLEKQPDAGFLYTWDTGQSYRIPWAGEHRRINAGDRLPDAPFRLVRVEVDGQTAYDDGDLALLRGLEALVQLRATMTGVTDAGLEVLPTLPALRGVIVHDEGIGDAGVAIVARLSRLQILVLGGRTITDAGIEHLGALVNLEGLVLGQTGLTDRGLASRGDKPRLTHLIIDYNDTVTDDGLAALAKYRNLDSLMLTNTRVSGRGLAALKGLERLNWLSLSKSAVTDDGLACLGDLHFSSLNLMEAPITDVTLGRIHDRTLHSLTLNGVRGITGAGLLRMKAVQITGYADLRVTAIDDAAVPWLEGQTALGTLQVQETHLSEKAVSQLRKALPKCRIESDFGVFEPAPASPGP